jgi:hypothetical protein
MPTRLKLKKARLVEKLPETEKGCVENVFKLCLSELGKLAENRKLRALIGENAKGDGAFKTVSFASNFSLFSLTDGEFSMPV